MKKQKLKVTIKKVVLIILFILLFYILYPKRSYRGIYHMSDGWDCSCYGIEFEDYYETKDDVSPFFIGKLKSRRCIGLMYACKRLLFIL